MLSLLHTDPTPIHAGSERQCARLNVTRTHSKKQMFMQKNAATVVAALAVPSSLFSCQRLSSNVAGKSSCGFNNKYGTYNRNMNNNDNYNKNNHT